MEPNAPPILGRAAVHIGGVYMGGGNYLKDLILLRHDPARVGPIRAAAERGEVDAQYALGIIYAEGRGVVMDLAQAHYWLSLAVAQGDQDAERLRQVVGCQMSDAEYDAAKRLWHGRTLYLVSGR